MSNTRSPKGISLKDFMPKETKRKDERYSHEKHSSRRRYNLRAKDFWNFDCEDSDDEDQKSGFVPKVKNWADSVDELDEENNVVMKTPNKRHNREFQKEPTAKRSLESSFKSPRNRKTAEEDAFPALSSRKRDRNADHSPRKFSVGDHPEFIKRRMRSGSDGVSTTSSSLNSSDNEQEGTKLGKKYETDPLVLGRRQKQIDYGKNTKAYRRYLEQVPLHKRTDEDISTPKKHIVYSRRSWDNLIKIWRKRLHAYDPDSENEEEANVDLSDMVAMMTPK